MQKARKMTVLVCALLAAGALTAASCGGGNKGTKAGGAAAPRVGVEKLLALVPGDAVGVGWVDSPHAFFDFLKSPGIGGGLSAEDAAAMQKELDEFLQKRTGLALSDTHAVVAYATGEDVYALAFLGARELGDGAPAPLAGQTELYRASARGLVVIGSQAGVVALLDTAAGKRPHLLAKRPELAAALKAQASGSYLGVALDVSAVPDEDFQQTAKQFGVERGIVTVSSKGLRAALLGDAKALGSLRDLIKGGIAMGLQALEAEKAQALRDGSDTAEGVGMIVGSYWARSLARAVEPRLEGDALVMGIELGVDGVDPTLLVAGLGVTSAVAIPAFMKYIRKSKTTEAVTNVKALHAGLSAYAAEKKRLPPSGGPTPPLGACCQGGDQCAPNASLWKGEPWSAIGFVVAESHYYSYEVETKGNAFTVRALGDLDCDGVYSTFEMAGRVLPDGTVEGADKFFRDQELE